VTTKKRGRVAADVTVDSDTGEITLGFHRETLTAFAFLTIDEAIAVCDKIMREIRFNRKLDRTKDKKKRERIIAEHYLGAVKR
jgi:hypothetical protein